MRFYQILLAEAANYDQLLSQFGNKLKLRFKQDNSIDDNTAPMEFIKWLDKNINPTSKHEVLQWIIKTYADGGIRLSEDLSRTKVALEMYFKYKNAMPMSLNSIKKLSDLESMVEKYGKQSEKSAADSDTRGYAKETTEVIYSGPEGKILWPRTKGASCVYGAGTKWCISATKSKNYFNDYSFKSDKNFLFILPTDGTKWALVYDQKTGDIDEAFNENDDSISLDDVFDIYPWVKKLLSKSKIFHITGRDTTATDISKMKPQDLVAAIRNELLTSTDLQNMNLSKYQQLALVEYDARYIKYINQPPLEIQLAAVKQNGHAIAYINNPTEQVRIAAVKHDGYAIKYIKNPSEQMQLAAVNQNGLVLEYINNPSEQMQLAAVKQNGYAIKYIKKPASEALQLAAVKRDGGAIKYINNPSKQLQSAAVNQDGSAIEYIKNPSEALQLAAVKQSSGYAIKYIKNPSKAVQFAAVNLVSNPVEVTYIGR